MARQSGERLSELFKEPAASAEMPEAGGSSYGPESRTVLARSGHSVAALDPSLWRHLPPDLQALTLEKLSFPSLVRFRSVCKRWNELILSPGFHPSLQDCQRKCVPLYFEAYTPPTVFNKRQNEWQQMSWSFLDTPSEMLSLLATAKGLLCFGVCGSAAELLVCNPVTKHWRRLSMPSWISLSSISVNLTLPQSSDDGSESSGRDGWSVISRDKEGALGMLQDRDGRSYKIVVAGVKVPGPLGRRGTLVYDSAWNFWTRGCDVPQELKFWRTCKPLASNGCIYFMSFWDHVWIGADRAWELVRGKWRSQPVPPWNIARYNVQTNEWLVIPLPEPQGEHRSSILPHLVEHRDRILIVHRVAVHKSRDKLVLSELTADGTVVPFAKSLMPVDLAPITASCVFEDWCVGQGNQLYVVGIQHYMMSPHTVGGWTALDFGTMKCFGFGVNAQNLPDGTWTPLPDLPEEFLSEWLFAFEPSLAHV